MAMSSPFESLKKTKKTPLNGAARPSNAPYRKTANDPANILYSRLQDLKRDKDDKTNKKHFQAPSDFELLSSMATRLSETEKQLRLTTIEVIDKDKKIKILEEKVLLLEKARGYGAENVQELEKKCRFLQQQIHDMEEFLADYGMIWVGPEEDDSKYEEWGTGLENQLTSGSANSIWNPKSSASSETFEVNFNLIVKNIEELNVLSGVDSAVISHTKGGATLKVPDSIPLTLYANGIFMFSGPFRPYSDSSTQRCVQDIMDGYFPSELQQRYPDGVSIKVVDKREVVFRDRRTELLFPGCGHSLEKDSTKNVAKIHSLDSVKDLTETKVSVETFLGRLPPSVIKNGKIIDIRSGVENIIKESSNGCKESQVKVIDTPVIQEIKSRAQSGGERPLSSTYNVATLRIKSEKGDQMYILKLKFTDTIASVRKYINTVRPELRDNYRIKTSFPNTVYDDVTQTLEEAGLVPNATLHILVRT